MPLEPRFPKLSLAIRSNSQIGLQKTKQANVNPFPSQALRMRSWKRLACPPVSRGNSPCRRLHETCARRFAASSPKASAGGGGAHRVDERSARRSLPPTANRPPQIRYWRPRLKKAAFADHADRFAEPSISGEARPSGARPANEKPRRARATNLRPGHGNVTFDL